jgi:chemotaxis response regulator CheB
MKLSQEQKDRIDEMLSDLAPEEKKYAVDCLKSKAVDKESPEEMSESKDEKDAEDEIPLDKVKMFENEEEDQVPSAITA